MRDLKKEQSDAQSRLRANRILGGFCPACGKNPPEESKRLCRTCLDKCNEKYKRKKERGCAVCGKTKEDDGFKICLECRTRVKEKRERDVANGLCAVCGIRPHTEGSTRCAECRRKKNENARRKHDSGICSHCFKNPLVPGKASCQQCIDEGKNRRDLRKKEGICLQCGINKAIPGQILCEQCKKNKKIVSSKLKQRIIDEYGGKCNCCGESEPIFLSIDHIDNNGAAHRREVGNKIYNWLEKHNYPKGNFQLLCFNCNFGKRVNGGICPHKTKEKNV